MSPAKKKIQKIEEPDGMKLLTSGYAFSDADAEEIVRRCEFVEEFSKAPCDEDTCYNVTCWSCRARGKS